MSEMSERAVHAVLNRDREEVRVPSPFGPALLQYLDQRGLHGSLRTDRAGDVITLAGEPDMGRVRLHLDNWEHASSVSVA